MSLQEFEALGLKKGMQMSVTFYPRGDRKGVRKSTGHVEYKGDGKGMKHTFAENNWANDFYSLWVNEIDTITLIT